MTIRDIKVPGLTGGTARLFDLGNGVSLMLHLDHTKPMGDPEARVATIVNANTKSSVAMYGEQFDALSEACAKVDGEYAAYIHGKRVEARQRVNNQPFKDQVNFDTERRFDVA